MVDADFNFKMPKIEMTEQSEDGKDLLLVIL